MLRRLLWAALVAALLFPVIRCLAADLHRSCHITAYRVLEYDAAKGTWVYHLLRDCDCPDCRAGDPSAVYRPHSILGNP